MRILGAAFVASMLALGPTGAVQADLTWDRGPTATGVFDAGGPMTHGAVVVAGSGALYLLSPTGDLVPFSRGASGYHDDAGGEAYLAVSPGSRVSAAGCDFVKDEIYALRLHAPIGVTKIDQFGEVASLFAATAGAPTLNGITFDTSGLFDHRLLVTAPISGQSTVYAVDCKGGVQVLTRSAPVFEGGLAVAPMNFGSFGGALIAPDELTGIIWAIKPDGSAQKVADSGLAHGGDIGVEGVGFVPVGFSRGGFLYFADRGTPGSAHLGTDSLLRMPSAQLITAGVQEGDLLSVTEGGATMIDVHCASICKVTTLVGKPSTAHGEGHLAFTITASPSPSPAATSTPTAAPTAPVGSQTGGSGPSGLTVVAGLVLIVLAGAVVGLLLRRRRS